MPKINSVLCKGAKCYSPYDLARATGYVKQKRMSLIGASRQYGIPYSTLRDRVVGLKGTDKPGPPPTFSPEEDSATVQYLQNISQIETI